MSDIFCVTNRRLCREDFLSRIESLAECELGGIILREKDLTEEEYERLASAVMEICERHGTSCILHSFPNTAIRLGGDKLHLPLNKLRQLTEEQKRHFPVLGASCHSADEAEEAERLGCSYITAGHVFATDCKKGLEPRGLDFLKEVCQRVKIPVLAIGGITPENAGLARKYGAGGICVMSEFMKCENAKALAEQLKGE